MKGKYILLLVLIILLGSFLRFYKLVDESFWQDEGATGLAVRKYTPMQMLDDIKVHGQILPGYYGYDDDLPLYYILVRGWTNIFGLSDFSLRAFSAFLGSLALLCIFYLAKYLFDEKVALAATFLSSINMTLILYSQEARQYSYLFFLSMLSVIFLLKSLKEDKIRHIAGFLIVSIFIIFTHFPWVMFITFEGAYVLYVMYQDHSRKKKLHLGVIAAFFIIGLLYLTIIGNALNSTTDTVTLYGRPNFRQFAEFGLRLSTWIYPSESMRQKIYDTSFNFSLLEWALLVSVLLTALLIGVMFLVGIKNSFYKKESAIFMLFMIFVPLLFALALSFIHPKFNVFHIKQMIYFIPIYLIFASVAIIKSKRRVWLMAIVIVLSILPLYAYYTNVQNQQFREAAEFLPKGQPIFVNAPGAQVALRYYYGEKDNVVAVRNLAELKDYLKNIDSFWMFLTFTKYSDPENTIKTYLSQHYQLIEKKEFFDIELLRYKTR